MKKIALGLLLALPIIGLISCDKKKEGYTVTVSVTDIGTAKVYRDTLKMADGKTGVENIKDSLVSKLDSNQNGAKITSVKVIYINEKGRKVEDKSQSLEVGGKFQKTYKVAAGKTIIVSAEAEGTAVGDTLLGMTGKKALEELREKGLALEKVKGTAIEEALNYEKLYQKQVAGKPTEVTLPTLSITIDKDGETIAAQSVTASKSNVKNPKDLTKAGEKTKVSATATAVAFEVK